MAAAETDVDAAVKLITDRVRAEEAITNRILGLSASGVDILGSQDALRAMLQAWSDIRPRSGA